MKRLLAVGAAIAFLAATGCSGNDGVAEEPASATPSSAATPKAEGSFSLLTYNVAGLPEGISQSHPEANAPIISGLLGDFDVVLTQEDFGFYTDAIRSKAPQKYKSTPHPGPSVLNPIKRTEAIAGDGLNIMSNLPIDPELDRVPWAGCGPAAADCLALKGFAKTTLTLTEDTDDPKAEAQVDLYSLHLEAGGVDHDLRADDLDQLAAYLATQPADRPVIIGGDWNLHTDEEPDATQFADFLATTGMSDVCDSVDCGNDEDVIDKVVFRSTDDLKLTPTSHTFERELFVDGAGQPLSDHDPLRVDFDWALRPSG